MATQLVPPRIHVIVLCDAIELADEAEGVCHLFGVRTSLAVDEFPYIHPELNVHLQMTGHEGTQSGTLLLVRSGIERVVRRKAIPLLEFHGPLDMIAFNLCLKNCEFPEPGLYYIQINLGGKLRGERFFEVVGPTGSEQ